MRRLIGTLVVMSLLLLTSGRVKAHGAGINAVVSTNPLPVAVPPSVAPRNDYTWLAAL